MRIQLSERGTRKTVTSTKKQAELLYEMKLDLFLKAQKKAIAEV